MNSRGEARRSKREQAVAEFAVSPATPAAIVELQRMLAGFVLELAPPLRNVVLWHYFKGLTSSAIARRIDLADSTVRWRLKQALDELRGRLEERAPNRAWVAPRDSADTAHAGARESCRLLDRSGRAYGPG